MTNIPMKPGHAYPHQINTKLSGSSWEDVLFLRSVGVDVGELTRLAVSAAVKEARAKLDKKKDPKAG